MDARISMEMSDFSVEMSDSVEMFDHSVEMFHHSVEMSDLSVEMFHHSVEMFHHSVEMFDLSVETFDLSMEISDFSVEMFDVSVEVGLSVEGRRAFLENSGHCEQSSRYRTRNAYVPDCTSNTAAPFSLRRNFTPAASRAGLPDSVMSFASFGRKFDGRGRVDRHGEGVDRRVAVFLPSLAISPRMEAYRVFAKVNPSPG